MAPRGRTQNRPLMDMGGTPPAASDGDKKTAKHFMAAQADDDKTDAKAKAANKGLRSAKDNLATMTKLCTAAIATDSDDVKLSCLQEIADLGNAVRDGCRAAMRAVKGTKSDKDAGEEGSNE